MFRLRPTVESVLCLTTPFNSATASTTASRPQCSLLLLRSRLRRRRMCRRVPGGARAFPRHQRHTSPTASAILSMPVQRYHQQVKQLLRFFNPSRLPLRRIPFRTIQMPSPLLSSTRSHPSAFGVVDDAVAPTV